MCRVLLFAVLWVALSHSGWATEIGIIQYNVKGDQGGWTTINDVVGQQIRLMARQVRLRVVDFIALQQADLQAGVPGPIISDGLAKERLTGWHTVVSACNKDTTQLAYSSAWELIQSAETTNPLLNGTSKQAGWIPGGCERGDGRPYNIAYFQHRDTVLKVLVVIVHLPHCHEYDLARCLDRWNVLAFHKDIKSVVGAEDAGGINLIVVGDMNELAHRGSPAIFERLFPNFGKLLISPALLTCCNDSNWIFSFDRIVSNSRISPSGEILMSDDYPLNPGFPSNEEHKAIFGKVVF